MNLITRKYGKFQTGELDVVTFGKPVKYSTILKSVYLHLGKSVFSLFPFQIEHILWILATGLEEGAVCAPGEYQKYMYNTPTN